MADHQPVDPPQHLLLRPARAAVEVTQQAVELLMITALAHQHTAGAAELLDGLIGDRADHRQLLKTGTPLSCPDPVPPMPRSPAPGMHAAAHRRRALRGLLAPTVG